MAQHEDTITVGQLRKALQNYTDDTELFFGCPDEANPLQFLGVEDRGEKFAQVHFQLNVYKGRD
jgi:sRNA-binding protein